MELPEETRASAAAMRRVVAEQIEALSELNSIVRSLVQKLCVGAGLHQTSHHKRTKATEDKDLAQRVREVGEW